MAIFRTSGIHKNDFLVKSKYMAAKFRTLKMIVFQVKQNLRFNITFSFDIFGNRHQGLFVDPWVPGLVEGKNPNSEITIFTNDLVRVFISVERVHQD